MFHQYLLSHGYVVVEVDFRHSTGYGRKFREDVTNWRNYYYANPWYTLPRLGDPEEVPEHYDRSSPLTYASELQRPVILLHGLIDDNVGAQDAFQYADELIQSGNTNFEMMIYPSERHGFTSPDSWYDEYLRIFEFFEKHLK
jgi:dipeptidyl aminopeptidase/acylaminoacyl peptidase